MYLMWAIDPATDPGWPGYGPRVAGDGIGWPGYGIGLKVSISSSKTGRIWVHSLTGAVM
jgi:hypothetical protein